MSLVKNTVVFHLNAVVACDTDYSYVLKLTTSTNFTVAVGKNFMARDIGFENSSGPEKHQAVALRSGSDFSLFYRCSFIGFQDTLYAHSLRQFYRECDIVGTVDFIFGDASAVFQNCNIQPRQPMSNQKNTITAQGRTDPNENTGISMQGCTIVPYNNVTVPTYLGRPWKNYSTTVIMQSKIEGFVQAEGWLEWFQDTVPPSTIFYAEYQNYGGGATVAKRVDWPGYHSSISDSEARNYAVDSFILGSEWLPATGVEFSGGV